MKNQFRKTITLLLVIGLIFVLGGITYAFFAYYSFSNDLVVNTGEVYMKMNKSNTNIVLNNAFSETYEEASVRNDNYIDFTIIGKNDYKSPVYYELDLEYGDDVPNKERIKDEFLRFELLDITNPNNIEEIFKDEKFNSINNERIFVDTINTTNYTRTYRLRMWIGRNVLISDTNIDADYKASDAYLDGINQDLTPFSDIFASVKVKVHGDFEPKRFYNVMTYYLPSSITSFKNNITEIYFINEKQDIINQRYENATIREIVTNSSNTVGTQRLRNMYDYGFVLAWLEPIENTSNYKLYIGSEGYTYLSTGYALFSNFINTTIIDLTNVRTNFVTSMGYMFQNCSSLTSLDLSSFNTINVTDMQGMFQNCSSLTSLNLSNFNNSNATNMGYMFYKCSSLESLNLSNFNTSKVQTMTYMFSECSSLTSLNLSDFNTSNLTSMESMFYNSPSLTSLDVSNFNTSKVTTMRNMFRQCSSLTSLDVSNFNTSNVTSMSEMFASCSSLTSLDLSNFNTSNVTDMGYMFNYCSSLTSLDVSNFNTSNVTTMIQMFTNCSKLTSLDLSNFNTINVTSMYSMFYQCSSLTSLDLSNFNTSNVTTMGQMFSNCSSLTNIDLSNFNTSNVENMSNLFCYCSSLTSLNLSNFNTSNVTVMYQMFSNCSKLTSIDLSSFNTSNVTSMYNMFSSCTKLKTIYVSNNWDVSDVTSSSSMFTGCYSLVGVRGTTYNSSYTDKTYARIDGGTSNPGYLTLKSS